VSLVLFLPLVDGEAGTKRRHVGLVIEERMRRERAIGAQVDGQPLYLVSRLGLPCTLVGGKLDGGRRVKVEKVKASVKQVD
jgi:hypothetical protein